MDSSIRNEIVTWLRRLAIFAFLGFIAYLAAEQFRLLDWQQVMVAVRSYGVSGIAIACFIVVPGVLACACFDLIGRHLVGHSLSTIRTMLISFSGYYFSLNLGALAGGLAFRYRLYSATGLRLQHISKVIGLTVVTNWLGYVLLAGIVLTFYPPSLPDGWGPGVAALRALGIGSLMATVAYLVVCHFRGGQVLKFGKMTLPLPALSIALMQYALSLASWGTITALLVWLMPGDIGPMTVLPVLMISAIAGIWSHVPGGVGVIEVVFLTLLSDRVPESDLMAAVLVFRGLYYLAPFCVAVIAYFYLEKTRARDRDSR